MGSGYIVKRRIIPKALMKDDDEPMKIACFRSAHLFNTIVARDDETADYSQYDSIYFARKPSKTHDAFLKRHAKEDRPCIGSVKLSDFRGEYFSVWSWIDSIENENLNDVIEKANLVYDARRSDFNPKLMYASPRFNRNRVEMYLKRLGILTW